MVDSWLPQFLTKMKIVSFGHLKPAFVRVLLIWIQIASTACLWIVISEQTIPLNHVSYAASRAEAGQRNTLNTWQFQVGILLTFVTCRSHYDSIAPKCQWRKFGVRGLLDYISCGIGNSSRFTKCQKLIERTQWTLNGYRVPPDSGVWKGNSKLEQLNPTKSQW